MREWSFRPLLFWNFLEFEIYNRFLAVKMDKKSTTEHKVRWLYMYLTIIQMFRPARQKSWFVLLRPAVMTIMWCVFRKISNKKVFQGLKPRLVNSQTKPALSSSVSKDSSTEFTDATQTDLHSFIVQTLHKNSKDRNLILNAERELVGLMEDHTRQSVSFQPMSSYERMIIHRVAAYFGLDHNVSQDGTYVICSKTDIAKM